MRRDVLDKVPKLLRLQCLFAHSGVGGQDIHDGADEFLGQVWRIGELILGVVRLLLDELLRCHMVAASLRTGR